MCSLGVFEVDLWIKGKEFMHPVDMINELNKNIVCFDFIHSPKLTYDVLSRQVKFAGAYASSIAVLKQKVFPAMTLTVIKAKYKGKVQSAATYVANICAPRTPMASGMPSFVSVDENNICNLVIENCAPYNVKLEWDNILGIKEIEEEKLVPLIDEFPDRFPKVKRKRLSREDIQRRCHQQLPVEYKERYINILHKHHDALSVKKFDLGLAKDFMHKIHLKANDPLYTKQFKITEQTLDEWLKLGVVKRSNLLYNSPILCAPRKQGQGLSMVLVFRELNQNSHINKNSMKEITECIEDIGRANSNNLMTLDLRSGFW
jgi:hypothetical protein